ncbi:hypothetical protein [Kutzneria sp. CA-103260]|uniref:hypothetical protein n=1 Tax=Kutzneria sp. CA-103260 TaxID=2802641 RepID=UPI001BADACF5|nr:hypothetical protein [Kutzneria sp. CA-103260]QUQ71528.1 hypothetical protein JJ691_93150 [Kutzneria sp. CA-103260]
MSGDPPTRVDLFGQVTLALLQAIPEVEYRLGRPVTLVGGLAVLSRLGTAAHRVTTDVDTVNRRADGERGQLEVLLASGATAIDGAGAMITTESGEVRIDVLEISERELAELSEDPTDRLYALAHDWALRTATPLQIRAAAGGTAFEHSVKVAEPGPLIATKLQALPNRSKTKEATDILDIIRLALDPQTGPAIRRQLAFSDSQLRHDAALHVQAWFVDNASRTLRLVRTTPAGADTASDTVALVGELLLASLR